jgi:HSP20 family molecular chaperone IbpA
MSMGLAFDSRTAESRCRQTLRGRTCRPVALREGGALRELRKGDTPELGKAFPIARDTRLQGPSVDIGRSGRRISNLRSIPPRTSTGMSHGSPSIRSRGGRSGRQYGARFSGGNHARRPLTASGPSMPLVSETAEPVVDIFDEPDCVLIIAQVPGAEQDSIRVELEDHTLKLQAGGRYRAYRGEVSLPADFKPDGLTWTLNNGIIELRLGHDTRKTKAH